jgi:TP901 family phage tail tape measure protein
VQQTGVKLVAKDADEYLATLHQVVSAEAALASATQSLVAALNGLEGEAASLVRDLLNLGRGAGRAGGDLDELGDDSRRAGGDLDELGDDAGRADRELDDLGRGAGRAGDDVGDLCHATDCAEEGLGAIEHAAIGAMRKLGELAVEGAMAAGQALLQFGVDGVKAAGDFEAGMNEFAVAAGDSLEEGGQSLETFKDLFISLGKELPVSTADVQQAAIALSKGGIEPAVIAGGALRDSLNFAAAAGMDLADAAELTVKQLGTFVPVGASVEEQTRFMAESQNLLVKAAGASTLNVDTLGEALLAAGGKAKSTGVVYSDFVTTMGLISPSFASAAEAGTSYKNFLSRLQPTTADASAAMAKLNLLTSEGTSKFYDANGAFVGNKKAAELLQGALSGLSDAERSAALQAIFGNDAMGAAVALADAGAAGYDAFADKMAKAADVAETAAKKQRGFNFAVDNLMGSLEAFQITVGSAVLPLLTKLVNLLASGVNAITEYADATLKGETFLAKLAGTVNDLAIPALFGITAATVAYAAASGAAAIGGIQNMGLAVALVAQRVALATPLIVANAGAVALAALPYVAIGAAIGVTVLAFNKFNNAVKGSTTQLLESRQWWNDSAAAIENYGSQTGAAAERLKPFADNIQAMRDMIQGEIEDLGRRSAAGLLSEEQYNAEMAAINAHKDALIVATDAYRNEEQAIIKVTASSMTATTQLAVTTDATAGLGAQASLTAEDIEKLGKQIQDTYAKGQEAVQGYASTQSEFLTGVETRATEHKDKIAELEKEKQQATTEEQRKGIDEKIAAEMAAYATEEQNAAASYAQQQAAQRQHLGQMLIDYTLAQAQLGNIAKDKAAEITDALAAEYGLQENNVASTFLRMAGSIDTFATSSSGSVEGLIGTLQDQAQQAADTQHAMDDYAKEYTATAVTNFLEAKGDAASYTKELESIPREVHTTITQTERRIVEEEYRRGEREGRAAGGPVDALTPYTVGEKGPELFISRQSGTIIPNDRVQQAVASPAQMSAAAAGGGATYIDNSRHVSMPVQTNMTPAAIQQSAAIVWSML